MGVGAGGKCSTEQRNSLRLERGLGGAKGREGVFQKFGKSTGNTGICAGRVQGPVCCGPKVQNVHVDLLIPTVMVWVMV